MRLPIAMKATGTHGGGRPSRLSSAPKLTLSTSGATSHSSSKAASGDDSDFEEF